MGMGSSYPLQLTDQSGLQGQLVGTLASNTETLLRAVKRRRLNIVKGDSSAEAEGRVN